MYVKSFFYTYLQSESLDMACSARLFLLNSFCRLKYSRKTFDERNRTLFYCRTIYIKYDYFTVCTIVESIPSMSDGTGSRTTCSEDLFFSIGEFFGLFSTRLGLLGGAAGGDGFDFHSKNGFVSSLS